MAEYDSVIPAGGSGTLRAAMKTTEQQSGLFSKSINVQTDAKDARVVVLRMKAHVEQVIVAKPRMFLTVTTTEGRELRGGLLLKRADGVRLEIHEVSSGNPAFTPEVTHLDKKEIYDGREGLPGDVKLELVGDPSLEAGTTRGTLRLETNHPDVPRIEIPYTMRVRPLIVVRPDVIRMWPAETSGTAGRMAIVSLGRSDGTQFSITGVEMSHPDLFTASAASSESGIQQRVIVRLDDDLTSQSMAGSVDGWIAIRTDDPKKPVIDIPVIVARNRTQTRRDPKGEAARSALLPPTATGR